MGVSGARAVLLEGHMQRARDVIFDTNALITACKFSVRGRRIVAWIPQTCALVVPEAVGQEATRSRLRHEDAAVAAELITSGRIRVSHAIVLPDSFLHAYDLGGGEKEAIALCMDHPEPLATLVTDDKLAYVVCDRVGIRKRLFLDFVLDLVRDREFPVDLAEEAIQACGPRYSRGFVMHSLVLLQEVERQWQN